MCPVYLPRAVHGASEAVGGREAEVVLAVGREDHAVGALDVLAELADGDYIGIK